MGYLVQIITQIAITMYDSLNDNTDSTEYFRAPSRIAQCNSFDLAPISVDKIWK